MAMPMNVYEEFWMHADKNNDGVLSVQELRDGLIAHIRQRQPCKKFQLKDSDIADMFCDIDKNQDGQITKKEYMDEMMKQNRILCLKKLFNDLDKDKSGTISINELKSLVTNSGYNESEAAVLMKDVDTDGDGEISFEEFLQACNRRPGAKR